MAKLMGEGKPEEADRCFSMLVYAAFLSGVLASVIGFIFARPIASALGAQGELLEYSAIYGRISFCSMPGYILQRRMTAAYS